MPKKSLQAWCNSDETIRNKKEIISKFGVYENSNNCENFVNRCVLGLDFSELNERKKDVSSRTEELDIQKNLEKTNYQLNKLTNYNTPWTTINKIKDCRRSSGYESFDINRDGIKMDACIEVEPKSKHIFKEMCENHFRKYSK